MDVSRSGGAYAACAAPRVPRLAQTHRGLLLIREDGEELLSRLDEGGFSHYYAYGTEAGMAVVGPMLVDSAWRALERA